ncbi:MAG: T9SS type A sorting domain-containing protein [Bacteroidia bacterium]|nr:T9SS type A sorting domain-containing protein [Bacteroidia bacterium]
MCKRYFLITFFFLLFFGLKAQVNTSDSLALVDMYNAMNGPNWINNSNWLTGTVSTWSGNATVIEDILTSNWPVVIPNTSGDEQIYDMAYDDQGNIYAIGLFNGDITLGSTTYYSTSPDISIFVAKYDYCGNYINGHVYGTIASTVPGPYDYHIKYLQSAGKVVVTGQFTSVDFTTPSFNGYEMTAGNGGVFLAFLDPATLFCTTTQEVSLVSIHAVNIKGLSLNGNSALITGVFSTWLLYISPSLGIIYNNNAQACCPHSDVFMARFDLVSNSLSVPWSTPYSSSISNDQGMATEWVSSSDIYFTYMRDQESYIVKIDASNGQVSGSEEKIGTGSEYFEINDMTSYNGKLYLCGFENTTPNSNRAAVISYPNLPNINWNPTDAIPVISTPSSGNNNNTANKIVANSNGVYVAGTFGIDNFSFDPTLLTYLQLYGSTNHFVTKFDNSLGWVWQTGVDVNSNTSRATSLVYDSQRTMYYVGGSFTETVELVGAANQSITSVLPGNDAFMARFEDINAASYYRIIKPDNESLNNDLLSNGSLSNSYSQSLGLFPNPTNGRVLVTSVAGDVFYRIAVTDITGREVYKKSFTDNTFKTEIDLSFLLSNTYIFIVNTQNNVYIRKLVIIK